MATRDVESSADDETPKPLARQPAFFSRAHLLGPVDIKHADYVLLAHSVATGIVDAACFSNWSVFAAMQTGNTVILGLSTAKLADNPHAWTDTLVSIASYLIGAFCTFRATMYLSPKGAGHNRLLLFSLFLAQPLLIFLTAALITANVIPHNRGGVSSLSTTASVIDNLKIVGGLPPLAFQAGIQIACSRLLGFNELPINVLTSTYCDLMGDTNLLGANNIKRNRRVASVVLLFIGAVSSGWLLRSAGGLPAALWTAGGVKLLAALGALLFFKRKEPSS